MKLYYFIFIALAVQVVKPT
jgi:hypothetical protein